MKASASFPVLGAVMATAIAVAGLYYVRTHEPQHLGTVHPVEQRDPTYLRFVDRSAAYHFGFANAALAGCPFSPGDALDQLASRVEHSRQGVIPDDVKAGFAEFQKLQQASGAVSACQIAEELFGPSAEPRPGVLLPR